MCRYDIDFSVTQDFDIALQVSFYIPDDGHVCMPKLSKISIFIILISFFVIFYGDTERCGIYSHLIYLVSYFLWCNGPRLLIIVTQLHFFLFDLLFSTLDTNSSAKTE